MKGDGTDERILRDIKKERQPQCLLMLTVSVIPLLSASLFQSDREEDEERLCMAEIWLCDSQQIHPTSPLL